MHTRIFEIFTVFLKNRNFISKMKRSKVTDYAALIYTMDYPDLLVLDFMGNFTGLLMIKLFLLGVLCASKSNSYQKVQF